MFDDDDDGELLR